MTSVSCDLWNLSINNSNMNVVGLLWENSIYSLLVRGDAFMRNSQWGGRNLSIVNGNTIVTNMLCGLWNLSIVNGNTDVIGLSLVG